MYRNLRWIALALVLAACSRGNPEQWIETARFEELQNNTTHARELYQRIVTQYPDSPQANEARQRLQVLEVEAPPAP